MKYLADILSQIDMACRHLLSEQNRDIYTPNYGCFDRRYWGWKIVDYPEATFQRNTYPLAWMGLRIRKSNPEFSKLLFRSVEAGLGFTLKIQHKDGSFDQAFPNEHSFGATAFLLHPLLKAYQIVKHQISLSYRKKIEDSLFRAGKFLCANDETHGHIANHIAGAVLALIECSEFFHDDSFKHRANELLDSIFSRQSSEGWFLEYEGADPGYQTLCLYYLAQVFRVRPNAELTDVLEKAIDFLSFFVHPDGTFAGEYGSRRTALFYPGGIALLSRDFPAALSITRFMLQSMSQERTITLKDVDMGNLAPLLVNYMAVIDADLPSEAVPPLLPFERSSVCQDFSEAGLYIRGNKNFYAIFGVSNGGVLKVYDRQKSAIVWNDAGYIGQLHDGAYITTQVTHMNQSYTVKEDVISMQTNFCRMLRAMPSPCQFVLLRLLNLTVMRNVYLGNLIKKFLVSLLIGGKKYVPLSIKRVVKFEDKQVMITDILTPKGKLMLQWLEYGIPFVSIHMASARYFDGNSNCCQEGIAIKENDIKKLNLNHEIIIQNTIEL